MKLKELSSLLMVLAGCFLLTGCDRQTNYMVRNGGTQTVYEVTMCLSSNDSFRHGTLVEGTGKSYRGSVKVANENNLAISWMDENGLEHMRTVSVTGRVFKDERMRVFTITPTMEIEESWRWQD